MKNKIWFISGISSGLGAALARAVMESGDFVIGSFRRAEQADAFNRAHSSRGYGLQMDLGDPGSVEKAVGKALSEFGRVDVLVNNAGMGFIGAVEETSLEEARQVFEVNVFGSLHLTQLMLPQMRKLKKGHIVQISSHGGIKAFAGFGIYNASKFALEGFSEALYQEVRPIGIAVSLVEPGPFRTRFAGSSLVEAQNHIGDYRETAGAFRKMLKGVDGKQEGDPEKAAQAILELVRSEHPPLRLPLGKIALKTIGMKLQSVQADLDAAREIAENAVF